MLWKYTPGALKHIDISLMRPQLSCGDPVITEAMFNEHNALITQKLGEYNELWEFLR